MKKASRDKRTTLQICCIFAIWQQCCSLDLSARFFHFCQKLLLLPIKLLHSSQSCSTYKSTISQDNKSPSKIKTNTRQKNEMTVSIIHQQYQMTYTTNYINFSTIKKTTMLEKDTAPNWDRMWSLNEQWQITSYSVCITPQGYSLSSMGIRLHLPVSMANLCDDNLNRVAYTRSRSGILSNFPTYIGETVIQCSGWRAKFWLELVCLARKFSV